MKVLNEKGEEIKELDLGIVEAGKNKTYTYILYNDTNAKITEMSVEIPHKEITIITSPKTMDSYSKSKLEISWSPSIQLKSGLKTNIVIKAYELYT